MANINKSWTTRQLKDFIRESTASMNYRLIDYYDSETEPNDVVEKLRQRLIELGTGKESKNGYIGLGLSYKTKAELLQQARALNEALKIDIYTPAGIREYEQKERQQYETFIKNRPALADMSIDEYHDLVEIFGSLGDHVLNQFGYEELAEIYHSATSDKKLDMVKEVKDIERQYKASGGMVQTDIIDELRARLS